MAERIDERRQLRRFQLNASAFVQTLSEGAPRIFELRTQDISSRGAFFPVEVPLKAGEKVKVTVILSISTPQEVSHLGGRSKIVTDGEVVRSTEQGMAVAFGEHYTLSPVAV
jgi:hypothetical protein